MKKIWMKKSFPSTRRYSLSAAGKHVSPHETIPLADDWEKKCTGSTNVTNGRSGKNGNLILMTWPKAVMNCFKAGLIFSRSTKTDFLIF